MIKAIIFDYIGVLVPKFTPPFFNQIRALTGISREEIANSFRKLWSKLKIGKISDEEFWKEIAKELRLSKEQVTQLKKIAVDICQPKKSTIKHIAKLSKKYKLYILSNACYGWSEVSYNSNGLKSYFQKALFSHNLKRAKPDLMMYKRIIREIAEPPDKILFVDDKEENIAAAKECGLKTMLFTDFKGFLTRCKKEKLM